MESPAFSPSTKRRLRRRWRVPPAIMYDSEALENAGVLEEHGRDAGLVLWQSLRDVTMWAVSRPSEREGLFASGAEHHRIARIITAGLDSQLEPPLGMITAMVGRPEKVVAERVALACRHISQWAEQRGKLATALAFAQAAAVACPGNASAAFKVGQIARRRAEYLRAETWFRRAIALGRQQGDWTSYALSFSGLGNLYIQRGNFPKARSLHTRALRAATRHALRGIQGNAYHDLCTIALECGSFAEAEQHARAAFAAYGPLHPRIHALAHDVAFLWMNQGEFNRSLPVFLAVLPHMQTSGERLVVLGNTARAAGGAGDAATYENTWAEVWKLVAEMSTHEGTAAALLNLSQGATSLGDWSRAQAAAERALKTAQRRAEGQIIIAAEAVLESIACEQKVCRRSAPAETAGSWNDADDLAEELVCILTKTAAAAG